MIESTEDLRAEIRALAEHEPDPARITGRLLMAITPEEAEVIVRVTLMEYVRRTITHPWIGDAGREEETEGQEETSGPRSYQTKDGRSTPSASTAAIRDWIAGRLHAPVNVSPLPSGRSWKFFGECTRDECLVLAENRYRKAGEVKAEGDRYAGVAEALTEHHKNLVGELPREVLEKLLKR